MPKIPAFNVAPPQFNAHVMPDASGASMARMGNALGSLGESMHKVALFEQQKANRAIAMDTENQVSVLLSRLKNDPNTGFKRLKGKEALNRPDGKSLSDEYLEQYDSGIEEILTGVKNPTLQQELRMGLGQTRAGLMGELQSYQVQQGDTYTVNTAMSRQQLAIEEIAANYDKPSVTTAAIAKIDNALVAQAQTLGYPDEWVAQKKREYTSVGHKKAIMAALLDKNPLAAKSYFEANAKHMEAEDVLTARKLVTEEIDTFAANKAASNAMSRLAIRINPSEQTKLFNSILYAESGNRQFDEQGRTIISPKGAVGIAQIMPETGPEAAKLAGLPWDEERFRTDAAYNAALGEAYFRHMLKLFEGDVPRAIAAYNAGPGGVMKAEKKAEEWSKENPGQPKTWFDFLPKETQDYVPKVSKAYESGRGTPAFPTAASAREILSQDPLVADNSERAEKAFGVVKKQLDEAEQTLKQYKKDSFSRAQALIEGGASYLALPVDLKEATKEDAEKLTNYETRLRNEKAKDDPEAFYDALNKIPELAELSNAEFAVKWKTKLSDSQYDQIQKARAEHKGLIPPGKDSTSVAELNRVMNGEFVALGLGNNEDASDNRKDRQRKGIIAKFVTDAVLERQRELGKRLYGEDLSKYVHGLFVKEILAKEESWWGLSEAKTKRMPDITYDDVKGLKAMASIKADLQADGISTPTEEEILLEYLRRNR